MICGLHNHTPTPGRPPSIPSSRRSFVVLWDVKCNTSFLLVVILMGYYPVDRQLVRNKDKSDNLGL